jgi:NADPH-dependent 2,4-dienoyl-CoA reductase/sulfur reductase-like enzyme/peroxiredoxin family protein/rhodanese-related sulfurtransferase/TusA-related sulfurtransferase
MKYLIVGGVAGGATTAARLRRLDEHAEIILFEKGNYVSYANCGLPYYIGGTISDRNKLFVQTAKGFTGQFNIDIRTQNEVTAIHPAEKLVDVKDLASGRTYTETYDKLVLSPGADPVRPPIPGIGDSRIFTLRNVDDTDIIKKFITDNHPHKAAVIGGGFIGLEMAENLQQAGIEVCVVEMSDQVMAPLDFSMASIVHHHLADKGIDLILGDGVAKFNSEGTALSVTLQSGKTVAADFVILSIGVRPDTALARQADLTIGSLGAIEVNDFMQTSDENIYALGDAVQINNIVTGQPAKIALAGPANKQGRIVADNMVLGNHEKYAGSIATAIAKVFDLSVASTGANAKSLKKVGIPYLASWTHSTSHAGYYPHALNMTVKIIFSPSDGKLLGAQIVGYDGVDKRIEMCAQTIQRGGTVYDLATLDNAYAPPYSSAKDPVNMAGFVADNILSGKLKNITWRDVAAIPDDAVCIDVRSEIEFSLGSIPRFVNIPLDMLRGRLIELPKDKPIIVNCAVGLRGYLAYRILTQNGFSNVRNLSGGYRTWFAATSPVTVSHNDKQASTSAPQTSLSASVVTLDACGLMCPGPIMQLKNAYAKLHDGETLQVKATDPAFQRDVQSWCRTVGAELNSVDNLSGTIVAEITKREAKPQNASACCPSESGNKTIIVFSDDLDKALASFVLANGAAATGRKVTMFFTFWGLNVIKKKEKPHVVKDFFGKMFSFMLPAHSKKLGLSKMNMFGLGSIMMRFIMKRRGIESLESLRQQAIDSGVEMIACTMSMDVMGVAKEELLDNVSLGGVATYMERADHANMNLFI